MASSALNNPSQSGLLGREKPGISYALKFDAFRINWICQCKAGCSAIKEALRPYRQPDRSGIYFKEIGWLLPEELPKDYWTFSVVRHPLAKFISGWRRMVQETGWYAKMPWSEFVEFAANTPDEDIDVHFKSQTHIIDRFPGQVHIFKLEDIKVGWPQIAEQFSQRGCPDIPRSLPIKNVSTHPAPAITDQERIKIISRYHDDYARFQYNCRESSYG